MVCFSPPSPKRRRDCGKWPYPKGLRVFSRPASLLLVSVATATASSLASLKPRRSGSRLADTRKSLATRAGGIFEMGSSVTHITQSPQSGESSVNLAFHNERIQRLVLKTDARQGLRPRRLRFLPRYQGANGLLPRYAPRRLKE